MNTFYLLFFATLFSTSLIAQPVITDAITPEIGDTWTITFMEADNFDPGSGGANQTWDFSGLDISNAIDLNVQILDQANIPGGPSYPDADFVWYLQGFEVYNYYTVDQDSLTLIAGASIQNEEVDFETIFIDPEDGLHFPMNYGDTYDYYSQFEQIIFGTSIGINERNGMVNVDAYGTVITPNGTYDNLLRIIITETSFGSTNTQYAWLDVNNFVPVFLYETSDDPDTPPNLYFSEPKASTTSADNYYLESMLDWNAWYDQSENKVKVETDLNSVTALNIQVYSIDGKLLAEDKLNNFLNEPHTVDLPATAVFTTLIVTLELDGKRYSKKVGAWRN